MPNLGPGEILVILVVALVVLGPEKLPAAARNVGRFLGEFRRMSSGFQAELRDALQEPVDGIPASASNAEPPVLDDLPRAATSAAEPDDAAAPKTPDAVDDGPAPRPNDEAPAAPTSEPGALQAPRAPAAGTR